MIFHQPHNSLGNYNHNLRFYTYERWDFHFHKNLELICVLEGSVECTVNSEAHTLEAGMLGLCLPYDVHAYQPSPGSRYWVLVFSEDYVRYFAKAVQGKTARTFAFRCSDSVRVLLEQTLQEGKQENICAMKACLYGVCGEFLEIAQLTESSGKRQTFLTVTDFLSKNYASNISLQDIAQLLGYQYHYVSRYFHNVFGMSFHDLLNLYRLEAATRLLEETDQKIAEIAFESGFQSVRSFNSSFRAHFGISPSQYKHSDKRRSGAHGKGISGYH